MRALLLLWALARAGAASSCAQLTAEGYAALEEGNTSASVEITTTASVILTSNEMGRRLSRQLQEQHPPSAIARDADARRRDVGTALNFLT